MPKTLAGLSCLLASVTSASAVGLERAAGETRTVSGAFTRIYWPDDGTRTELPSPPPLERIINAILVPDGSSEGYAVFPVELQPDYTFETTGVPAGPYFLQMDRRRLVGGISVIGRELFDLSVDTPDLSTITSIRPDLARVTQRTDVSLKLSNLQPWEEPGDALLLSTSQADVFVRIQFALEPPIEPGATSYSGVFDWHCCFGTIGLPDASRGDVLFLNQRSRVNIGMGETAAVLRYASRYARFDDFTLVNGQPGTLAATLLETPQTGLMRADVRGSQFAALAPAVHPSARPSAQNLSISIQASPHTVEYPDHPEAASTSLFFFQSLTNSSTDADYDVLAYPQFHDPIWVEYRQTLYSYDVTLTRPDTGEPVVFANFVYSASWDPMYPAPPDPIAPRLGPPTEPLINAVDAFQPNTDVGLQPTLSWSPPNLGTPTVYSVSILSLSPPSEGEVTSLFARLHGQTSFTVPPGILQVGNLYVATIEAFQAPWDAPDRAVFRFGAPYESIPCVTGIFTP